MVEIGLTCENAALSVDRDGVLRLRWTQGTAVSPADAEAVVAAVKGTGDELRPIVVDIEDVWVSPGARRTLAGTRFVSAVALVGATVVDRVIAATLLRGQDCPFGYFTSEEDAKEWLARLPRPELRELRG